MVLVLLRVLPSRPVLTKVEVIDSLTAIKTPPPLVDLSFLYKVKLLGIISLSKM